MPSNIILTFTCPISKQIFLDNKTCTFWQYPHNQGLSEEYSFIASSYSKAFTNIIQCLGLIRSKNWLQNGYVLWKPSKPLLKNACRRKCHTSSVLRNKSVEKNCTWVDQLIEKVFKLVSHVAKVHGQQKPWKAHWRGFSWGVNKPTRWLTSDVNNFANA